MNIFCLFCFHWTIKGVKVKRIYIKRSDKVCSFVALCVSQVICCGMLLYFMFNSSDFQIKAYNRTGNTYLSLNYMFCCVLLSITYIYFYVNQKYCLQILEMIVKFQTIYTKQSYHGYMTLQRLYFLYLFLALTSTLNYYRGLSDTRLKAGVNISFNLMLSISFIICGLIVTMHICIIKILTACLRELNNEIWKFTRKPTFRNESVRPLYELITKRKLIIDLCQCELSYRFGLIQLPIVAYIMFYIPSGPFYLLSVLYKMNFDNIFLMLSWCFTVLYWDVPWLVMFVMLMTSNDIQDEVITYV